MLELKSIKKSYVVGENRQLVLKGIDIKFRKNEFTSILGSSGSGKTTLLNIIGGLDKYDSGDLVIEGVSTKQYGDRDWDAYRNYRVGFIFQSYNLIMHQSVLSNVEMALTLSGVSKKERKEKAVKALERVGLKDHINKKPNQLSGGQMQRVAIARAIVNDPEIILADEPTGALDSKTSVQIMDLLKEIAEDKLVIMVTHNPELAKEYSTRIIELKDGLIINDTNPVVDEKEENRERTINKTSMSLLTSLSLSFNNLMTKKGRTFLTAFAGSIGIIGIGLILSLSNGVNNYAKGLERDSLTDYPITIERTSYDIFGTLSMALEEANAKNDCEKDKLCSKDDIVKNTVSSSDKGLLQRNNTREFKKYLEQSSEVKKYADSIEYGYGLDLQVYSNDYNKVNPSELSINTVSVFEEIPQHDAKFKVLAGKTPENYNEVALIVGKDYIVKDSILYSLGIKDKKNLTKDLEAIKKNERHIVKSSTFKYDDLLNKTYKVILNTDYYKEENGLFIDYSNNTSHMHDKIDNGIEITIVGVLQSEDESNSYVGFKHDLTMEIIDRISKTNIYDKQINNKDVNVLTGLEFDGVVTNYEDLTKELGIYEVDEPATISIYPKDYDSKNKLVDLIKDYNTEKENNKQKDLVINYSDVMKTVIGGVTKVVDIVSYVLIGFVAISLIVSSIMISIITYISVLERTKEIGILRAIGASKKDIIRVFRAETIIEGAVAGLLGVGIAMFLSLPINLIVKAVAQIDNIAKMPFMSAVFLVLLSILLNVIAGSIPSRMAAKKDPVEALRSE